MPMYLLNVEALNVVLCKELHILAEDVNGCIGCNVVAVVGGVIPNVNAVADLAPILKVLYKGLVCFAVGIGQGMRKVALKGAQTHANVGVGLG